MRPLPLFIPVHPELTGSIFMARKTAFGEINIEEAVVLGGTGTR